MHLTLGRSHRKLAILNQGTIIAACIHALRKVERESWTVSFKKVSLHPHHRLDFNGWCRSIDSKLKIGEQFSRTGSAYLMQCLHSGSTYQPSID
jgi:hypothetical protein